MARNAAARRRSVVTFLFFLLFVPFFFVFLVLVNLLEFERICSDDFEVAPALGAGDYVALLDVIFFNVQIGVTLGTQNHFVLPPFAGLYITRLMSAGVVIATSVVLESNSFRRQVCANIRKGTLTLHNSILPTVGFASLLVLLSIPGVTQRNPQLQTPQAPAPAPIPVKQVDLDTATPDPQIVEALKEISGDHIRAAIERLVTFKNRNTLSSNDQEMISQGLGVTAAA